MANVKLSEESSNKLDRIMTELEISAKNRAEALRLAFAKGIDCNEKVDLDKKSGSGHEFPTSVIMKKDNELLIKHLIINKLGHRVDGYNIDRIILSIIENGINKMFSEIEELSQADTYLFYLLDKHQEKIRS